MALYLSRHRCQRLLSRRGGMEEQEELQTTSGNFSLAAACWEVQKGHQVTSLLFRMPQLFSNSNRLHLVQAVANAFSMSAYLPWLSIAESSLISCLATSLDLPSLCRHQLHFYHNGFCFWFLFGASNNDDDTAASSWQKLDSSTLNPEISSF